MKTVVYFVRHAESDRTVHDDRPRPLTAKGVMDSLLVTNFLKDKNIEIILSSPYRRAVDTIKGFAESIGKEIALDEAYREREIGIWVDDIKSFIERQWADFSYKLDFPNSESLNDVQTRSTMALQKIIKDYEGKNIVIGTHGNTLATIINYFDDDYDYKDFKLTGSLMPWVVKMEFDGNVYKNYESIDLFR
ncbi:MAG: histidine phosphatase family protein [Christensenellaceae bacterium]|jgi:2,3-bisphosphoglycerate-dependent phosphoglycerate mutase|nr:histidine phosphatase family protein [Christensenellaceae bacterium]